MALSLSNVFLQGTFLPSLLPTRKPPTTTKPYKRPQCNCKKRDLHPTFYEDAKVYCNGEHVLTVGGTSKEYIVDVWSGNHPFYLNQSATLLHDDQLTKFRRKYGDLTYLTEIPEFKGENIIPPESNGAAKDGVPWSEPRPA